MEFVTRFELPDDLLLADLSELIAVESKVFVPRKGIDGGGFPTAE